MRERRIPALALPVVEVVAALTVLSVGLLAAGPAATVFALGPSASPSTGAPSPSGSPTPSVTPTAGVTPAPSPSGPTPTPGTSPTPSNSPSATPTPTPVPTPTAQPTPPNTPSPINVTSSALQVSGFTYAGNSTLTTPSGPIAVMRFTMSDAVFTNMVVLTPCAGHSQLKMSQTGAHATGSLTLDLTWFTASLGGTTVAYTASSPPAAQPLSSGAGTFSSVSMIALAGSASALALQGTSTTAVSC